MLGLQLLRWLRELVADVDLAASQDLRLLWQEKWRRWHVLVWKVEVIADFILNDILLLGYLVDSGLEGVLDAQR